MNAQTALMFATIMPPVTIQTVLTTVPANQDFMETEKQAAEVNHYGCNSLVVTFKI